MVVGSIPTSPTILTMKYSIIFILLTMACGTPFSYKTDAEFTQYVQRFQNETGITVTTPIIFDDGKDEYAGLCEVYDDGYKLIRIDSKYWELAKDLGKEEVIYHELGHCELKRDHIERLTKTSLYSYAIPSSVMFPYVFGDTSFYWAFREHYVQELIHPGLEF